jgi:hypothetical protein
MAYQGKSSSEFADVELVRRHLEAAADFVADATRQAFREWVEATLRRSVSLQFDSPLEALFWVWWVGVAQIARVDDMLMLSPQHEVAVGDRLYRVDFLVRPVDGALESRREWVPIAVEVDGHEFHERTPAQVALRDSRDRALQAAGWRVFHFSFREFTSAPVDCMTEVVAFARNQWNRASMARYIAERAERQAAEV